MMLPKAFLEEDDDALSHSSPSNDGNSKSGASWISSSATDKTTHASEAQTELAMNETRMVKYSKALVIFVLLAATAACAAATYRFTANQEEDNFRAQVSKLVGGFLVNSKYINQVHNLLLLYLMQALSLGEEILEKSAITAANSFSAVTGMSTTITSYALDQNLTFPFVTMPHFDKRGTGILQVSGASFVVFCPLVKGRQRSEWEAWSVQNDGWIPDIYRPAEDPNALLFSPTMIRYDAQNNVYIPIESTPDENLYPVWQLAPITPSLVNFETLNAYPYVAPSIDGIEAGGAASLSAPQQGEGEIADPADPTTWPTTFLVAPVYDDFEGRAESLVGIMVSVVPWHNFFRNILSDGTRKGMYVVIENVCDGAALTYQVNGQQVTFLGPGDLHDPAFDYLELVGDFHSGNQDLTHTDYDCSFWLLIYPTRELYESTKTTDSLVFTLLVVFTFIITSMVFVLYDCLVQKRQARVLRSAQQSNAIVSSLFPAQVRDRLIGEGKLNQKDNTGADLVNTFSCGSHGVKNNGDHVAALLSTKPIADLFPNTTVMFADISGFTAWASAREPSQVFTLLEQIYNSFDASAKKKRIFKVETIGDCYVAAAGVPDPRKDHAVAMARFANKCRTTMKSVVNKLEVLLGPDTADLAMRFGLHSGPVTAGVLRGEKSRFQLFGDTVNTAARMESTGTRHRIHISQATADLLIAAGKMDWVKKREGMVSAKGKGLMQTYWLTLKASSSADTFSCTEDDSDHGGNAATTTSYTPSHEEERGSSEMMSTDARTQRLIEWNVDVLLRQLKKIIAMRDEELSSKKKATRKPVKENKVQPQTGSTVLDEVKEVIPLSTKAKNYKQNPDSIEVGPQVLSQLRNYVSAIAAMYHENPFHSFQHASHVTLSVTKLLARVVTPDSIDYEGLCYKKDGVTNLHEYTYGITSDPLIHFACAFSALIHDVDHSGLPNAQLVKENVEIAKSYNNKSVAEQNSVDIAWHLLMEPAYGALRTCIYQTHEELERFRQLIVNAVMATDIADKEQAAFRRKRWERAFRGDDIAPESMQETVNRKATIVIEHLIQASDVAHTMQHWHVYLKWNERLFHEMYKAYLSGRADTDPSEGWYKGELGFFDFYIIPLAIKLKDCGVFGVASDEYLDYAIANRTEWEIKGKQIVQEYLMLHKKGSSLRYGLDSQMTTLTNV
jgi:class 3 adenylate cyclase